MGGRKVLWAAVVLAVVGCGNPLDVTLISLVVNGEPVVSPGSPSEFMVTVENTGSERITWGMGSSSCQLSLFVIADGIRHPVNHEVCTDDLGEQGLNAGERRTEDFEWGGAVPDIEGEPFVLPEGRYRMIAAAGSVAESNALWVTVAR